MKVTFNFSIFLNHPPEAFGMADGYGELEQTPKVGERIDVLGGKSLDATRFGFNGHLKVLEVLDVQAVGPLLMLEDLILADRDVAVRLSDFLEKEANLFVTDWAKDLGMIERLMSHVRFGSGADIASWRDTNVQTDVVRNLIHDMFGWLIELQRKELSVNQPCRTRESCPFC